MNKPAEEVIRILAPANPDKPHDDAWHLVTLTRPLGSTDPVWRPFAAYGPMPMAKVEEFLTALGAEPARIVKRSEFPILHTLPRG